MKKELTIITLVSFMMLLVMAATGVSTPPEEEWSKTFGGADYDWGEQVQQTSDGGYIIVGRTYSFGAGYSDVYLIKTDSLGNEQWSKTFGGAADCDEGFSVQQTSDGGYIIVGRTWPYEDVWAWDVYLIKTDSGGNEEWSKTFGGANSDVGLSVQQTSDGGYIIVGDTSSFGAGDFDVYLIKTDSLGNEEWSKTFGGTNFDEGYSVQQTSDGGYIIVGATDSFGAGDFDVYLIKTDSGGNEEWSKTFGGADYDWGYSAPQTSDGGYIIAGETGSFGAGSYDVYLIKTDSGGNEEWSKTFGGADYDWGYSAQHTSDGGYIIAGATYSFGAGASDVYLIKLGPPNTPTGTDVEVTLDSNSDGIDDVSVTFASVTESGYTSATTSAQAPEVPGGYQVYPGGLYYQISTIATYTAPVTVSIYYNDLVEEAVKPTLKLWKYVEGTGWVDITTQNDLPTDTIYGVTDSLSYFALITPIKAVDMHPDTLNLKSKGKHSPCYIELPDGNVSDIDVSTVELTIDGTSTLPADSSPTEIGDYDGDTIPDLMVNFDRASLQAMVSAGNVGITVMGSLIGGTSFEGTDTITVIEKGVVHTDETDHSSIEY